MSRRPTQPPGAASMVADRRFEGVVVALDERAGAAVQARAGDLVSRLGAAGANVVWIPAGAGGAAPASTALTPSGRLHVISDPASVLTALARRGIDADEVLLLCCGRCVLDDPRATVISGSPEHVLEGLADQLRRRVEGELPAVADDPLWSVTIDGFDPRRERAVETVLVLADGRFGTSGNALGHHAAADPRTLAGNVYVGDGAEATLLRCPIWTMLRWPVDEGRPLRRVLDLRHGVVHHESRDGDAPLRAVAFASLARPGTMALRAEGPRERIATPTPLRRADDFESHPAAAVLLGNSGGVAVTAHDDVRDLDGGHARLDRVACYVSDATAVPPATAASELLDEARHEAFDGLLAEHRAAWARRWDDADIRIEGDDDLQRAVRFALFQLMASAATHGEAVIGARGISGTGYRGHVFWDTDVFVLPFLAATHPPAARAVLEYRLRRLSAARRTAERLRRSGARFPWESAADGIDVTPTSARDRAGHVLAIRTGLHEEHIVADVAWGAAVYVDWTGDEMFAAGPGLELTVETARYWASRIRLDARGAAHIYDVIGPDEYHEPVDDNAFTNVMARWNLRRAVRDAAGRVDDAERRRWHDLADALVDGYDPATGLYEEFAGFFRLEPLVIADLAPRPVAAPLLLGAQRTAGAQVVKQTDVLMLHHLIPDEVAPSSLDPNLRFYEPRTAHGSSLSPAIHASLFARAGRLDEAVDWLRCSAHIDLDDIGHSTAGGLHLATMGGVWQALTLGFAGVRPFDDALALDPHLPPAWQALELRLRFHGSRVRIRVEPDELEIAADPAIPVALAGRSGRFAATPAGVRVPYFAHHPVRNLR